ncbi:ATP-binding cassette domain-containing protein [Alphaproteobacteria bacterium GH1-50]|uniref:ATP-binding cassette domain-containing protein n=1 Tax=Kangsaoukella pontilimi TaxID=2691042 RepID=A0A7C9ITK8_9RHOB|nr:sugar ABC transporter ATP-binding protein [Kangsaoukella pontilimi]MXQ09826.1 ATP-binding cassette domain-containing protein [Kangsaoukella pontilimi]
MTQAYPPVLKLTRISRSFGKVKAVNNVSLQIDRGEVIGLTGENGAGKSTLLKILAGIERPDEGTMEINGKVANFRSPNDAFKAGVGVVHQEQSLFTNLSVAENIEQQNQSRMGLERFGFQNWKRINADAAAVLKKIGVNLDPKARVGDLSFVDRQMVEIARAVCVEPGGDGTPLIILDEPTAVLEQAEVEVLEREILKLKKFASVIFVSHRLDEVLRICDRVLVMRHGVLTSDRSTEGVTKDELFKAMVDDAPTVSTHARSSRPIELKPAIEVQGLTMKGKFRDISFAAYPGRITALVGTNGSGRGRIMRALFGAEEFDGGTIEVAGKPVHNWSIRKAVAAGLAYVPAERKVEGMIGGYSGTRNIALVHPGEAARGQILRPGKMAETAQSWFDRLDVNPNNIKQPLDQFSGGNQQKVVLAKWLNSSDLKVLMLDHPLRGLDVGVSQAVNAEIRKACDHGTAVILIPDTIEEALEMADEIIVLRDGQLSARHDLSVASDLAIKEIVAEMV